jgi:hypothetical protein
MKAGRRSPSSLVAAAPDPSLLSHAQAPPNHLSPLPAYQLSAARTADQPRTTSRPRDTRRTAPGDPHPALSPAPAPKCCASASNRQEHRAPQPGHHQAPSALGTRALKPQPRRSSSSSLLELQSSRYYLPHYSLSPLTP